MNDHFWVLTAETCSSQANFLEVERKAVVAPEDWWNLKGSSAMLQQAFKHEAQPS